MILSERKKEKMDKSIITVNILGSEYTIKGAGKPEYIISLANYLNNKMLEIQEALGLKDEKKIAILAAINITDELFELRKKISEDMVPKEQLQTIRNKVEGMITSIDKELLDVQKDAEPDHNPDNQSQSIAPGSNKE